MSAGQTPAIEALDLRKRYRAEEELLRGVPFRVEPGTSLAYLGRNGGAHSLSLLALKPVRASRHPSTRFWVVAPMSRKRLRARV